MPCRTVHLPGGMAITCSRERTKPCHHCGRGATALCDFPLSGEKEGKTCDRPMCARHAHRQGVHTSGPHKGDSIDYCLTHHELAKKHGLVAGGAQLDLEALLEGRDGRR